MTAVRRPFFVSRVTGYRKTRDARNAGIVLNETAEATWDEQVASPEQRDPLTRSHAHGWAHPGTHRDTRGHALVTGYRKHRVTA